jgi:hypothetical protein
LRTERSVETLDGLQQPELRDLHEVVKRLAPAGESASAMNSEPTVTRDQLVADAAVVPAQILSEQRGDLGIVRHASDLRPAGTQKPDVIAYF